MSHEGEKVGGPQAGPVTGSLTVGKKLTKAQKREQREIQRKQIEVEELVKARIPPSFALPGQIPESSAAPGSIPVTVLRSAEEERKERKKQGTDSVMGRPSEYTQEEADQICAWIADGGSLKRYCAAKGRTMVTVYRWMREHADFHARYAQAHEDRADTLTDEMMEIADEAAAAESIEAVTAAKLRVETRKWIAQKLRPQKWGDKQIVQHQGAVNIRIGLPAKATAPQALDLVEVVENRPALEG